jgi:NADH-quinone oxidoreductase subunit J
VPPPTGFYRRAARCGPFQRTAEGAAPAADPDQRMTAAAAFFYLFASVTVASGFMVIASRNPVASVLFLILAFVNAAGLFVLMGAEFLAMILVVVYVGAVAVLFLFVVMMLDVDFAELRQGFQQYLPIGGLIGAIFLVELLLVVGSWSIDPGLVQAPLGNVASAENLTNAQALGRVLYTDYAYFFQLAGLILLVAMIGAIVLTLRDRPGVKRQDIAVQNARTQAMAVETRKVPSRQGVEV